MKKFKFFAVIIFIFVSTVVFLTKDAKSGAEPVCAMNCYSEQIKCVSNAKNSAAKLQCMSVYAECLAACPQE